MLVTVEPLNEAARATVCEIAARFVACGGRVTLAEWVALEPDTRAALSKAVEDVEIRRAAMLADAIIEAMKIHFSHDDIGIEAEK